MAQDILIRAERDIERYLKKEQLVLSDGFSTGHVSADYALVCALCQDFVNDSYISHHDLAVNE